MIDKDDMRLKHSLLVPIAAPRLHSRAIAKDTSLTITWDTLNIMDRQGIISKYMIKFMKNCEYLRLNGIEIKANDECDRVPANNTKLFDTAFVDGNLTSVKLNNLAFYVYYRCEVCAGTDVGFGPCESMNYRTDGGGKLIYISIIDHFRFLFLQYS